MKNRENKIKSWKKNVYLDVVFVVSLHHRVCVEIIFRSYGLALTPCPGHILFLSSHVIIVVHQTQHQLDPISSSF